MILDNRRIAIRDVADDVSLSFGSCQASFSNVLEMKRVAVKIGFKIAKFWAKKQRRMDIAQEMLTFNDDSEVLKKVITGGESCVYGYDIETKAQ